jgi:hypothetical protein
MPVPDGDNIFMAEWMTRARGNGTAVQHGGIGSAQGVQRYLRETKLEPLCLRGNLFLMHLNLFIYRNASHEYGTVYFMLQVW